MNAVHILENKISSVQGYLDGLKNYDKYTEKEIEEDIMIRRALERDLYLLTQSTIDLAEAVVSYKKLRKPSAYKETFEILRDAGLIDNELTNKLTRMVGFRNVIAHEYIDLSYKRTYEVLIKDHQDIKEFLAQLKKNSNLL